MKQIEIKNITKSFGNTLALSDVSLNFNENTIYGLLGRNGAGKSTLLKTISNRIFPDSGTILINGESAFENDHAQNQIYLMSENNYYPSTLKISEVFKWTEEFYNGFDMDYAKNLCEMFELNPKKKISSLSTGYSSIYKLITALCVDVPFVFLDEPVLGLDANHRDLFYRQLINSYENNPRTFIISTHLIEEISGLIENIVILKDGKVIRAQPCEDLLRTAFTITGKSEDVNKFTSDKKIIGSESLGELKTVYFLANSAPTNVPGNLELSQTDLQKLFIKLTEK